MPGGCLSASARVEACLAQGVAVPIACHEEDMYSLPRSPMVPVVPFLPTFLGEGSPTKIDCRKKGTLEITSLLEDPVVFFAGAQPI